MSRYKHMVGQSQEGFFKMIVADWENTYTGKERNRVPVTDFASRFYDLTDEELEQFIEYINK